jgi:1,4-dihydroxy-2-naphthoyl-CoA hydrolase
MTWNKQQISLEELNTLANNTLASHLNIRFTEVGEDCLMATMPVNNTTHQPYGLLHGGASAALAETIGSVASWLTIDTTKQVCVGIEINCNHISAVREGLVTATATPLHLGATTHVWDIKINNNRGKLVCVSRLTVAILKKK